MYSNPALDYTTNINRECKDCINKNCLKCNTNLINCLTCKENYYLFEGEEDKVEENLKNRSSADDQILDNLPSVFPEKGLIRFYQEEDLSLEIHTKLQEPYLKDTYLRIRKEISTRSRLSNGN